MAKSAPEHDHPRKTAAPPAFEGDYSLFIGAPDGRSWVVPLSRGRRYVLGRDEACDVVLGYPWVSKKHAALEVGDGIHLTDLDSSNGTACGARRLEPGERAPLGVGGVISIGGISLIVQRGRQFASDVWPCLGFEPRISDLSPANSLPPPTANPLRTRQQPSETEALTRDSRMSSLYALARQVADSTVSVLILGETGVGKELLARAIHQSSPRAKRRFVVVNCAAIPENLVESELFGYERGAFSGAANSKPGLFEVADGSTLFLDEVGELPALVQSKLLRALDAGEVLRLGALKPTQVDVRIVAATNRELSSEVADGHFRADLFYRLNGISLAIPPLRERSDDILALARHFAARFSQGAVLDFTQDASSAMLTHPWPGNVRELRAVVERAVLLAQGGPVDVRHLLFDTRTPPSAAAVETSAAAAETTEKLDFPEFSEEELPTQAVRNELARRERRRIQNALERTGGNQKEAAKLLGISRRTLLNRLDQYGLARPRKRPED